MTAAPRPAADPGDYPDPGDVPAGPAPAGPRPHILVVNGRKVRQPVFIIGAPCSGIDLLARALKRSAGFHFTLGQRWVIPVVQAFARRPSISRGKPEAAATVLRDAFAQAWQVTADCCLGCTQQCREAGRPRRCRAVRQPAGGHPLRGCQPGPDVLHRGPARRVR